MTIGAYAVERDYSHYVAYLAKTIFAVVGAATKGPVNEPTLCTSAQDLINKFGTPKSGYYGLYAGQYFLSQSSRFYFVRAAGTSKAQATTSVAGSYTSGDSTNAITSAVTFRAKEYGSYMNGYTLTVAYTNGTDATGGYTLTLKSDKGTTLETLTGVSFSTIYKASPAVPDYKTDYLEVSAVHTGETAAANPTALTTGTYSFAGGDDGATLADGDITTAANTLTTESVDMNLVATPGFSSAAVITHMLTLAENRGDCLYLVDPPKGLARDGVIAWSNGTGAYATEGAGDTAVARTSFSSSYGALYYDWLSIYDSINKMTVSVPPSVIVASSIAYSDRISELWYAPAGLTRGLIRGALSTESKLNKSDVEALYEDGSVNAIYDDPQVGLVIWGQKTLMKQDTALNRINVRRLMNYLKRVVTAACNYLTFEPNDRMTWNSFEMKIVPVLDSIKTRRGIYEYQLVKGEAIVTDEDVDNYSMPCMIMLRPTKAAEQIPIYFTITSTGVDFNEVLESNGIVIDN